MNKYHQWIHLMIRVRYHSDLETLPYRQRFQSLHPLKLTY